MGEAAAKEPTMEDILSSIRKIIAEEDGSSGATAETKETKAPVEKEPVAEQGSLQQLARKMAATDSSVSQSEKQETSAVTPDVRPPSAGSSLADVAASVQETTTPEKLDSIASEARAAAAEVAVEKTPASESEKPSPMANSLADIAAGLQEPDTGKPEPDMAAQAEEPIVVSEPEPVVETMEPEMAAEPEPVVESAKVMEPAVEAQPVSQTPAPQPAAQVPTREEAEFKGALMSPSSNTSVSDSFDRLKRSVMDDLDAKTEAILRPMLREWLDENLPNMVERMVREEIERVARGM